MFRAHYSHAGSICIYSQWLNLMDTSQRTQQAKEKPGIPWVLINCSRWGARSLPPAAPLISNLDEAAGPPGTYWAMTRTILTSVDWAGQSAQLYPSPAPSSLSLSPFCDGYPVHSLCQCSLFQRCQITPSLSLWYTSLLASQHEFPPFYYRSNNQLVLRGALLGKSADRASASWISLLLLWFNTNIIFCDQMADASLPPRAWLYPFKPQHMNFTTVKRQGKGE